MRIATVLLAAAAFSAVASPALACSCRCPADAATLVRDTPLFLRGRPVAQTIAGNVRRYTFEIVSVHKGEAAGRVTLRTALHSATCGVTLPLDQEVLVGARPGEDGLRINLCTHFCMGQKRDEIEALLARCVPGGACPPER